MLLQVANAKGFVLDFDVWFGFNRGMFFYVCFLKAHEGGVVAVELSRVIGGAPQLITIGADKTLAIWDTISFKVMY